MSRIIAHRGNLLGPNEKYENTNFSIEKCISEGFDVEIDVRYEPTLDKLYLGHDNCGEELGLNFLHIHKEHLWIHCKSFEALNYFAGSSFNYFWHENDDYTITNHGKIWAHPKSYTRASVSKFSSEKYTNTILVLPENSIGGQLLEYPDRVFGVCTDYPYEVKFIK
jgi:glycerophosphoryl diester phosphodiesterase